MALEAVGGAGAILGIVETGFALGSALAEYIHDVGNVPKEVTSLPDKITETLGLIEEVGDLLAENQRTQAWKDAGVLRAQQNIKDCGSIIVVLQSLLQKAGIPEGTKPTVEDLNLSLFSLATWPFYGKHKVKDARDDLDKLYGRVSVTILTYQVRTSNTQIQKAATERRLAKLLAQELPKNQAHGSPKGSPFLAQGALKHAVLQYSTMDISGSRASSRGSSSSSSHSRHSDELLSAICEALKGLAREEVASEEAKAKQDDQIKQKLRDEAVKQWQNDAKRQLTEHEARREQLRSELSGRLEASAIEHVLDFAFPANPDLGLGQQADARFIVGAANSANAATGQSNRSNVANGPRSQSSSRFRRLFKSRTTRMPELDTDLREMVSPKGRTMLRGFAIAYDKEQRLQVAPMGAPQQVLLEKLSANQSQRGQKGTTPWQEYALLPTIFRDKIQRQRKSLGDDWLLVHLERILARESHGIFGRSTEHLQGIYIIFNHITPPGSDQPPKESRPKGAHAFIGRREPGDIARSCSASSHRLSRAPSPKLDFQERVMEALRPKHDDLRRRHRSRARSGRSASGSGSRNRSRSRSMGRYDDISDPRPRMRIDSYGNPLPPVESYNPFNPYGHPPPAPGYYGHPYGPPPSGAPGVMPAYPPPPMMAQPLYPPHRRSRSRGHSPPGPSRAERRRRPTRTDTYDTTAEFERRKDENDKHELERRRAESRIRHEDKVRVEMQAIREEMEQERGRRKQTLPETVNFGEGPIYVETRQSKQANPRTSPSIASPVASPVAVSYADEIPNDGLASHQQEPLSKKAFRTQRFSPRRLERASTGPVQFQEDIQIYNEEAPHRRTTAKPERHRRSRSRHRSARKSQYYSMRSRSSSCTKEAEPTSATNAEVAQLLAELTTEPASTMATARPTAAGTAETHPTTLTTVEESSAEGQRLSAVSPAAEGSGPVKDVTLGSVVRGRYRPPEAGPDKDKAQG